MKTVLAISGGVDSVALLDMVMKGKLPLQAPFLQDLISRRDDITVAHFDHGIRDNSADDAELVKNLSAKYKIECVVGRGQLGKNVSEQLARQKRYEFLRSLRGARGDAAIQKKTHGLPRQTSLSRNDIAIVTAHHQDDLLETVVMNLIRGTGWRGLAPFWSDDILRPLLNMPKAEIVNYAIENNLEWVEDETNYSLQYFRNRVRDFVVCMPIEQRQQLLELSQKQVKLRAEIEKILRHCECSEAIQRGSPRFARDDITTLPENVAIEVLRKITDEKLTTPQLKRLLKNLKIAKSGDIFQPGGKIQVGVYRGNLTISKLS
jgi:tRNA(Ile)-lysidine synthase